jgi:hypothetical protein
MNEPVVVGELVAGHASKVLAEVTALIKGVNTSTFDLAEKLHEVKAQKYYVSLGFDTFAAYTKSLDLRPTKSYYLSRIVEIMQAAGVARSEYEAVGIAKLRLISKLNVFEEGKPIMYGDLTMAECIKAMVEKAHEAEPEQVAQMVAKLQGKTGDDEMVWLNIAVKRIVREKTILPALALAKLHHGSVATDAEGISKDASDGQALEDVCADYLSDPANNPTE